MLNTYGDLPNSHLLHMYGFAEPFPENHFDAVSKLCVLYYTHEQYVKSQNFLRVGRTDV